MNHDRTHNFGRVYLVGAGPGDPGLITARGLSLLRQAQVVVYDALANPALLEQAPAHALKIDAGKRAQEHTLTQDQTSALLVEHARAGKCVVRLKGGDPYLFGRGAEEAIHVAQHGIAVEIVPGVTSGIAALAYAGIPVTHRDYASSVTFITAHEDPRKSGQGGVSFLDYQALAQLVKTGGTLCVYMGMGRLAWLVETFLGHGVAADTPAAVVQWGTTPRQRLLRSRLGQLAPEVFKMGLGPPALIVLGKVAGLTEPGLDFFLQKPLLGQRVIITRTRDQSSRLRGLLEEQGALVLEAPTIQRVEPVLEESAAFDEALRTLHEYQWLVLTSAGGVESLAQRMAALELDGRALASVQVAVVGESTAAALWNLLRLRADLVPAQFDGDALGQALTVRGGMGGKRLLLVRADLAREDLPRLLANSGAQITEITAYHTRIANGLPNQVMHALREHQVDWVTFTSGSTARNLVQLLGDERGLLAQVKTASIGPVTSDAMRQVGLEPTVQATEHDVPGLVRALVQAVARQRQQQQQ